MSLIVQARSYAPSQKQKERKPNDGRPATERGYVSFASCARASRTRNREKGRHRRASQCLEKDRGTMAVDLEQRRWGEAASGGGN